MNRMMLEVLKSRMQSDRMRAIIAAILRSPEDDREIIALDAQAARQEDLAVSESRQQVNAYCREFLGKRAV